MVRNARFIQANTCVVSKRSVMNHSHSPHRINHETLAEMLTSDTPSFLLDVQRQSVFERI